MIRNFFLKDNFNHHITIFIISKLIILLNNFKCITVVNAAGIAASPVAIAAKAVRSVVTIAVIRAVLGARNAVKAPVALFRIALKLLSHFARSLRSLSQPSLSALYSLC